MSRATRQRALLTAAIVLVGLLLWSASVWAQGSSGPAVAPPPSEAPARSSTHEHLRAGDEAFAAGDFAAAELEYRRAAEQENSYRATYNLGVALARQDRDAEAAEAFARAQRMAPADDPAARADAAYNAGTAAATTDELEASVNAYVDALQADPHDREAKENLTQVLRRLRQQQEQQQQQDESQESERGEGEPEGGEPQEGDTPPEGEEDSDSSEEQSGEPEPGEEEQPQPSEGEGEDSAQSEGSVPEPGEDVEREEAERLLNLARELERETQEKLKLGERTRTRPEKDW